MYEIIKVIDRNVSSSKYIQYKNIRLHFETLRKIFVERMIYRVHQCLTIHILQISNRSLRAPNGGHR